MSGRRKILVVRFSALGDVAMTVPVVYSVCRANPDVDFVMVTRPLHASAMIELPENLTVVPVRLEEYKGLGGLKRLFDKLYAEHKFDAFADLHNVLRTKVLALFCRLHRIPAAMLKKARARRRALVRRHNKVMLPLTPQRARFREVFHRLGLNVEDRFSSLYGEGKGAPAEFAHITGPKQLTERWIGIAPFAKHRGKTYPLEQMRKVAKILAEKSSNRLFLFGGKEEQPLLSEWAKALGNRVVCVAGQDRGLPAEIALMSHLDVMLSMDSANMHLASLTGVPVVTVWGATHPYCGFRAFRQKDNTSVQLSMACRPCSIFGNKPCHRGDYLCMSAITPQSIVEKVNNIIESK
mgnify:FL=1